MNLSLSIGSRTFSLGVEKSLSPSGAAWLRAEDLSDQPGAQITAPYAQSAWVYIAVSRLAEKVASIPFRISQLDASAARRVRAWRGSVDGGQRSFVRRSLGEHVLESGDAVNLFCEPHPSQGRNLFWETLVTFNALRGEFFIVPLDANDQPVNLSDRRPRVQRMLALPPEMFWQVVNGYNLTGWRYTGSPMMSPLASEMLLPSEVIHGRTPNPYIYWRGLSPLATAMVAAGADFAAAKYAQGYWLNNADTGVIVTTEQQPDELQRKAILAALQERKRKAGTADRPLFLWGGAKVEKPQLSGMEQQFIENRKMNRQEIAAIFKVPESVMGFTSDRGGSLSGGGAAIDAEQLQFVESTIAPLCARIEAALAPLIASFGEGLVGWFDLESLPVMQQARRARLDAAAKAFQLGVPLNDLNKAYDLGFPEYPWGQTGYLPFSLQAAGTAMALPAEEPDANADADNEAKGNPFARMLKLLSAPAAAPRAVDTHTLWQSHIATRRKAVKQVEAKCGKVLNIFRARALAKLAEQEKSIEAKGIETRSLVNLIFDAHDFGKTLYSELSGPIAGALQTAGNELRSEVGLDDPWSMPPHKATHYLASRSQPIQGVGGTVRDQLNTALTAGLEANDTFAQLAARVKTVFTNLQAHEAMRIAQTEVNTAYNDARHDSMGDAGIEFKAWLSSHGPTVREAHAQAEKRYDSEPILLDEPFEVGGERLMYPGDSSLGASPGNTINCQCVNLAARRTKEDSASRTYLICGLGKFSFTKTL